MTVTDRVSVAIATIFLSPLYSGDCMAADAFGDNGLEEIHVTTSRVEQPAEEASAAVSKIDEETLRRMQPAIVTDALNNETGVFVQQTTPGQGTAIVRGLKGSEILHLVDGIRLNNALFRNAPNQYLALVEPFALAATEVVRGPLSTLYGSDAMGGVVHLISRRPRFGGDVWRHTGRFVARFDGANLGKSFHGGIAAGDERLSLGVDLSYRDFQDLRGADRQPQAPSGYKSRSANGFIALSDIETGEWELSFQLLEQPATPRYDELVPGFGATEPGSELFLFEPNSRYFVQGVHRSSGWSRLLDRLEIHAASQIVIDDRRTQSFGSDSQRIEHNRSHLYGLTLQAAARPAGRHAISYGVDLYHDTVSSDRTEIDTTTGAATTARPRFPDGSTIDTADLYVHDAFTLTDDLSVAGGARFSMSRVDLEATADSGAAEIDNNDITGSLGLRWSLSKSVDIVANAGRGFRAPNIFDLGTLGVRPGDRFNIANPDLDPETVWTFDFGAQVDTGVVSGEALVWYSDYNDKIVSVLTGMTDPDGRDIVQSQNAASVELWGVEAGGAVRLSDHWRLTGTVNYTRGDTTFGDGSMEPADRVPPLAGRIGLDFDNVSWWLNTELHFAAEQDRLSARDVRDPRIDPLGTAGWGVLNLRAGGELATDVTFAVAANNLLDRRYRSHGSGINGAGRHLALSIELRF